MTEADRLANVGIPAEAASFLVSQPVYTGLTATGTTIADAYQLKEGISVFGTVDSGTGAKLPACGIGQPVIVQNLGANNLEVYPPTASGIINSASAGGAITLAAATDVIGIFIRTSTTNWIGYVIAGPAT